MSTAVHLALSEIWRNRSRFLLFSLVVALITVLILFVAALGAGLLGGIREFVVTLDADLIVYQESARLAIEGSRIDCTTRNAVRGVEGVADVGPLGFASASVVWSDVEEPLDVSLIGVEPGRPGEPAVVAGDGLLRKGGEEALIDRTVARVTGAQVGDTITVRSVLGREDKYYSLSVVGITGSRKYGLQPSVIVPIVTWDRLRPRKVETPLQEDPACNVLAVELEDPENIDAVRSRLLAEVDDIDTADRTTAYESIPGYGSIRTSLSTQRTFALLIGTLVIGGFFQIQTIQKIPQIGMLKAIGTSNSVVAVAALVQIVVTILVGVALGGLAAVGIAQAIPPTIPIVFELGSGGAAAASIVLMGTLGGMLSIYRSLRVEPLGALKSGA